MTKISVRYLLRAALVAVGITTGTAATCAPISWIGGNSNWDATITKWNPNDEPDADDEAIFNTSNTVNLANASESIMALTMSGGIELLLNGNDLTVNGGDATFSGAGTLLEVPTNSTLNTDDVFVNADASLVLRGGILTMAQTGGEAVLTVAAGGSLGGIGTINSADAIATANTTVLSLSGNLTVTTFDLFSVGAGTLAINLPANGRVDLDQAGAVVDITRNDTLDINGAAHDPAVDPFSGTLNLADGATIDMSNAWGVNAGSINANTNGVNVNTAGAAATIAGAALSQTGGTINLADNLDSLRFSADFTATGGSIINNGLVIVDDTFVVGPSANFQMTGSSASITVNTGHTAAITQDSFDLGGAGNDSTNVTTIHGALNVFMDFDSGAGDVLDQRIEFSGGILHFVNTNGPFAGNDTTWHLSGGVVNVNGGLNRIAGDALMIQSETINVANATLIVETTAVEITNPTITINAGGKFDIDTASRWSNSAVSVSGAGTLRPGTATIDDAMTWNPATVDIDDGPMVLNANLTINASSIDDSGDGVDGPITISDAARLTVNLSGGGEWTLDPTGIIAYNGDAGVNHYLAGSDIAVNGTINHTGDGRILARIDIGATGVLNILGAGLPLILGSGLGSPNTIAGGTINGPGYLGLDSDTTLRGFGTMNADFGFHGTLKADNGILNVNGMLLGPGADPPILGTADADGILNMTNAWNTDHTASVELQGGELRGAAITNGGVNGINGFGLVSARVVNNSRIDAEGGGTLVVQNAANDNDWDGADGVGQLNAISGDLEMRDDDDFAFSGVARADAGRTVFANGFELQFQPGSTLNLTQGTYRSLGGFAFDLTGDFGGTITVNAGGPSRMKVFGGAEFLSTSTTTLNDDLFLENGATYIRVGATFVGSGALVNLPRSGGLALEDGVDSAHLGVLVRNDGTLILGKSAVFVDTAAQVSAASFEQTDRGSIAIELGGLGPDQFDRLDLTGTAMLNGELYLRVFGGYVPALGDTFDVLAAAGGLGGTTFASVTQPAGIPAGRFFSVIYSPTTVQLLVISKLPGDYNNNGTVDAADYAVWRNNLGQSVMLPNDSTPGTVMQADYDVWRAHFGEAVGAGTTLRAAQSMSVAVPEPISWTLLILVTIVAANRRWLPT